jgi:hypothetical protein
VCRGTPWRGLSLSLLAALATMRNIDGVQASDAQAKGGPLTVLVQRLKTATSNSTCIRLEKVPLFEENGPSSDETSHSQPACCDAVSKESPSSPANERHRQKRRTGGIRKNVSVVHHSERSVLEKARGAGCLVSMGVPLSIEQPTTCCSSLLRTAAQQSTDAGSCSSFDTLQLLKATDIVVQGHNARGSGHVHFCELRRSITWWEYYLMSWSVPVSAATSQRSPVEYIKI